MPFAAGCFPLRVGPDGVETFVEFDDANRVEYVRRGPIGDPIMMATYSYYADGLVHSVTYGNGTSIWYEYDVARRLTWIRHKDPVGHVLLQLNYEYNDRDEVERIIESSVDTGIVIVEFTYDNRGRLIHEVRGADPVEGEAGVPTYDLTYQYDQGGNRTLKMDAENNRTVVYHYDIDDPELYGSDNNRLMYYETYASEPRASARADEPEPRASARADEPEPRASARAAQQGNIDPVGRSSPPPLKRWATRTSPLTKGGYRGVLALGNGGPEGGDARADGVLLSTTWYYYNESGNPTRIVTNEADSDHYTATRFKYASNQMAVTYIVGEEWNWDGDPWSEPTDYGITYVREFRYDQARARYLNRELDPVKLMLGQYEALSETWSDYDGDEIYGDFEVNGGEVTNLRSFEPGMAKADPWTSAGSSATSYYHSDIIGTTRMMSDPGGDSTQRVTYTAFGERIEGTNPRYGYAGAWGYQAHGGVPYLHVGARYYDPSTGRFLQRDPIGIAGGLNVYEYCWGSPVELIDPEGAYPRGALEMKGQYDGFRRSGMSPSEASEAIAEGTKIEAAVVGVAGAAVVVTCAAYAVGPYVLRWLNRGKFRIGPSFHKGKWRISIRWKNKHWDVPWIEW